MADYTNIPGWLTRDLWDGKITNKMFNVMVWLFSRANFKTGIVKMVSAKRIQLEQWADDREQDRPCERTIQEILYRLDQCRYITSHHQQGVRGSYPVTLHNYPAVKKSKDGAVIQVVLNPTETLDWHDLPKTRSGDKQPDLCGDASGRTSGEGSCDASGDASAYTSITSVSPVSPDSSLSSVSGKGRKERRKEDASFANAHSAISSTSSPDCGESDISDQEEEDLSSEITSLDKIIGAYGVDEAIRLVEDVGFLWLEHTHIGDGLRSEPNKERLAYILHNSDNVEADFKLIFHDCPATAGIQWRDLKYFAENFNRTLGTAQAWKRAYEAKLRAKAQASKHGACWLCRMAYAPYEGKLCDQCEKRMRRASKLIAAAVEANKIWSYPSGDGGTWIGEEDSDPDDCVFLLGVNEDYPNSPETRLAAAGDLVMDKVESFVGKAKA